MTELALSIGEPFTSPAWGSNFVLFHSETGFAIPESETKEYLRRCCKYAQRFGVYLVPERMMLMGYQCMSLISPEGKVIGAQRALHLGPAGPRGAKRGNAAEVLGTEFGGIFLCVDVDIYRPQVVRIAGAMGAQILIASQQIARGDYDTHMVLTGAWNAAQLGHLYVIDTTNQYSCVCAPLPLTPLGDGFLSPPNRKLPLTLRLDAGRLNSVPRPHPLSRKLYALHRDELTA